METIPMIKDLEYEGRPIHVFLYDGKITFSAYEVGEVLDIIDPSKALRQSKALEKGIDYDVIKVKDLEAADKKVLAYGIHADKIAILYLSGFFLFVLRSNKPIAVPFSRWVIREAIPIALEQTKQKELSETAMLAMISEERKGSLFARDILLTHGLKPANPPKQLPE